MLRGQTRRAAERAMAAGAAGIAGALLGCRPGGTDAPAPASAPPVRLLFGRRSSAPEQPVLERYVATYRQVSPQTTVELAALPSGLQEMRQGLITGFAGGTGPD